MTVSLADILLARFRLIPYLRPTPLEAAPGLGQRVALKLENCNFTHSFKVRGALNALLALSDAERARGIVAASTGNHAQGVAYAAKLLGVQARIVMPKGAAPRKVAGVARHGAEAILYGDSYDDAEAEAHRLEQAGDLTYISPYNDPNVVAGAGTIGLEIVEKQPDIARVIVPVGGGGLVSGIAVAIKSLKPSAEVIGINASAGPALYNALYGTDYADVYDTLADALPGEIEAGSITLELARQYVDRVVLVSETAIADAMRWLVREQGWLVEGGGAAGVAALLCGALPDDGRATVVVVSGGNVGGDTLARVLAG